RVGGVSESSGGRGGQQDDDAAESQARAPLRLAGTPAPRALRVLVLGFELAATPAHLALVVLFRAFVVAHRSAQPRDPQACRLVDAAVDVDAAGRSGAVELRRQAFERRIAELQLGVVVARYVEQWHIGAADQVLEVVKRQIAGPEDQVRP